VHNKTSLLTESILLPYFVKERRKFFEILHEMFHKIFQAKNCTKFFSTLVLRQVAFIDINFNNVAE